jgi:3'(2'), 5'-bisphosphate nucleotidase
MTDAESLGALVKIAQEAGRAILELYAGAIRFEQKEDSSPLTEADLRSDRIVRSRLAEAWPGIPVISEEFLPPHGAPLPDVVFLVDPLDGTKEFIQRTGEFTVNIALVSRGKPVVGVVHVPVLGQTYMAAEGFGAWRSDASGVHAISVTPCRDNDSIRIVGSRSHGGARLQAWLSTLERSHEFTAAGSSLKFCRIAEGAADLYPRLGPTSWWDTAAAQCVVEQAGGRVTTLAGESLTYKQSGSGWLNPEFVAWGDAESFAVCRSLSRTPTGLLECHGPHAPIPAQ